MSARKMPPQRPGRSFQEYATPREFLEAVKKKFDVKAWAWDLAANKSNAVMNAPLYFGPDHPAPACRDALAPNCDWTKLKGDLWLNPEYADIAPWAAKCAASNPLARAVERLQRGIPSLVKAPIERRIFLLVPAAVGSNWFADHVDRKALVVFPRPRLSFDGKNSYPKDVMLAVYGERPGFTCWRWKENTR